MSAQGGTDIWAFAGKTTIDEDMKNMYADADAFSLRKDVYESVLHGNRDDVWNGIQQSNHTSSMIFYRHHSLPQVCMRRRSTLSEDILVDV